MSGQLVVVIAVVAAAAAYVLWGAWRTWASRRACAGGCGCGKGVPPAAEDGRSTFVAVEQLTLRGQSRHSPRREESSQARADDPAASGLVRR